MSIVSHLYHLFNPETCQSYSHPLRWKDRPLHCPRCQSLNVGPWGPYHAQPGLQRYRCKEKGCQRPFNDLTSTRLDGSKRSVMHWILATFLLCLSYASRRLARELGGHVRTSYRWCWWLRHAALSYEIGRKVAGTVEADALYHTAGHKGQAKTVQKAAALAMPAGRQLSTDSASSSRLSTGEAHDTVHHTQQEDARGEGHEKRAEGLLAGLKSYGGGCRGIRKTTLPGDVGFWQFLRHCHQLTAFEQAEMILYAALDPAVARRAKKGECVMCWDHFELLQSAIN